MLNKLLNIFTKNKKNILLLSFLIIGFFYLWDTTFAANADDSIKESTEKVAEVIRWISSTITVFLSLLTYLAVMFLSPEWINGTLFGLNWYFKQIWILVSNVVYFVFAFILIWIAFMNIIWKWQDKYQLKQALPKFFIWIMIVPLSWFLVNFILSISSILTISAINLPYDTFPWFNSKIQEVEVPNKCIINLEKESWKSWTQNSWDWDIKPNSFFHCEEASWKTSIWDLMNSSDSSSKIFSVLGTYAYGIIWLENIDQLNNFDQSKIKTILDLVVKLVFDVLFIVVYAVLMIALALVLMTRWIYIWIYMMISPLFWLMYFFDKSSGWWEFFDKFNIKQFISLAMVPVYTMLALTFGLLFIFVVAEWMAAGNTSTSINWLQSVKINQGAEDKNESILVIGWSEDDKENFSLVVKWAAANEENLTNIRGTIIDESNWTLWVIGTLIMKIFGIVVLWWAVMAALRTNEVTKAVVEPLHAFGTQVWQLATKSPQYAPIFGGQSMQSMKTVWWAVEWHINQWARQRAQDFNKKYMPFLDADTTGKKANLETLHNDLKTGSYQTADTPQTLSPAWRDYLKNIWDTESARRLDTEEILKEFARKIDVDLWNINFWTRAWYAEAIKKIESGFDAQDFWALQWNISDNNQMWIDDLDRLIKWVSNWNNWQNNNDDQNQWNNQDWESRIDTNNVTINLNALNENITDDWELTNDSDLSWLVESIWGLPENFDANANRWELYNIIRDRIKNDGRFDSISEWNLVSIINRIVDWYIYSNDENE